jgi:hypothetical protein
LRHNFAVNVLAILPAKTIRAAKAMQFAPDDPLDDGAGLFLQKPSQKTLGLSV